ncbi:MAG: ETX/MTX2 family pore-forming toxin [Silvanigrellaceae bacterium]|nr:ETX/MTX2 family pore-forming toxin [Silvanigrellaceae bacterium]
MAIILSLIAGLNAEETKINVIGSESHVIKSYEEAKEFSIHQNLIRSYFVNVYTGAKPVETYIRDYCPWSGYGNKWSLYKKYGWDEVKVSVKSSKVTMLNRNINLELIVEDILDNKTNRTQRMTPRSSRSIEHTFSIKWTEGRSLATAIGVGIDFGMDKLGSGLSANYSFTDTYSSGKDETKSIAEKFSAESGGMFFVPPKTCTKVSIYGKTAKIKAEIEYVATLSGQIAVSYDSPFYGHYFWAFDIRRILEFVQLPSSKSIKQVLETSYVFNTYTEISDLSKAECDTYRENQKKRN